jgi:hypothetical protein
MYVARLPMYWIKHLTNHSPCGNRAESRKPLLETGLCGRNNVLLSKRRIQPQPNISRTLITSATPITVGNKNHAFEALGMKLKYTF